MGKVMAVVNQKGGVGKTTLTVNLGVGLTKKGRHVLLIDTDPQGDLGLALGLNDLDDIEDTMSSYFKREIDDEQVPLDRYRIKNLEGVDFIPCNIMLSALESKAMMAINREHLLEPLISYFRDSYDYILIDCSPSLNWVTINVLTATNSVIIPIQAHFFSTVGLQQLLSSIQMTKMKLNKELAVDGIVVNMFDQRARHPWEVVEDLRKSYGNTFHIFDTMIPYSVLAYENTAFGESVYKFNRRGKVAEAFSSLTEEVISCE